MNYQQVLDGLKTHTKIVVTGPQRSGTTIAARMLATDLEYEYLLEEAFGTDSFYRLAILFHEKDRIVIQAPSMASVCQLLPVAVVFMRRPLEDILWSQDRINWNHLEVWEKRRYFYDDPRPVAQVKYEAWEKYQKPFMGDRAFDLDYDSLAGHPLWVDKEKRKNFGPRQTKIEPPILL